MPRDPSFFVTNRGRFTGKTDLRIIAIRKICDQQVIKFCGKKNSKKIRQKKGYLLKKSLICDSANSLIKNRTPQGVYNFDKVFKKKKYFCFSPKMAIYRMVSECFVKKGKKRGIC